jgi:hypothetical protein
MVKASLAQLKSAFPVTQQLDEPTHPTFLKKWGEICSQKKGEGYAVIIYHEFNPLLTSNQKCQLPILK